MPSLADTAVVDPQHGRSPAARAEEPSELSNSILATSVVTIVLLAIPSALVHDLAGTLVLGGGLSALVWNRRHNPADVIGLFMVAFCAAPFLRRIHDLRHGWTELSIILLSPYICFLPLVASTIRVLPRLRRPSLIPLVFGLAGLLWAFSVGLWNFGAKSAIIGAVEWFGGPLFFCYIALSGRKVGYQRLGNWMTPLIAVEAIYGLYQWTSPPLWDAKWLVDSNMTTSMGSPFPFMMRTFGTLNSTGPFALICGFYLIAGLGWKRYTPVAILVAAALATSMVRSSWGISLLGILLAVVIQTGPERGKIIRRLALLGSILVVAGTPFISKFGALAQRISSLGNLAGDTSFNERKVLLNLVTKALLDLPEGVGLGAIGRGAKVTGVGFVGMDNGFLATVYMMGWAGATLFLSSFLVIAIGSILKGDRSRPELATMGALALVLFASNVFGTAFADIGGILSWTALAIAYQASFGAEAFSSVAPPASSKV